MPVFNDNEQRKIFQEVIKENILGPGSCKDIFHCNSDYSDEIINRNPVEQYNSGILFPKTGSTDNFHNEEENEDDEVPFIAPEVPEFQDEYEDDDEVTTEQPDPAWHQKYYPNHIGLIFCLSEGIANIDAVFTYAKYSFVKKISELKVKFGDTENSYHKNREILQTILNGFIEHNCYSLLDQGIINRLDEVVAYSDEDKTIYLSEKPKKNTLVNNIIQSKAYERKDISGMYKKFKEAVGLQNDETYNHVIEKLAFLFENSYYKREIYDVPITLTLAEDNANNLPHFIDGNTDIAYRYKVFLRTKNGVTKKFVKLLMENNNPWILKTAEGDSKHGWKLRSIFQAEIKVLSDHFTDYKELIDNAVDEENTKSEYLYRDEKSYGKGIGCAIQWDDSADVSWLKTSYMPEAYIRDFSNEPNELLTQNEEVLKLKSISLWSQWSDERITDELNLFVDKFELWCINQAEEAAHEPVYQNIYASILNNQNILLNRLRFNIDYLRNKDNKALECFKIANSAMYLQMIIARDPSFRKNRNLDEITDHHFNDLNYFSNLDYAAFNPKLQPKYRPFQLAFLLMNIKSTFEQNDTDRNLVDLIWFPTGGGKTEAYLALTALTIIVRRKTNNDELSKGVSVIMRYTLRLLTAQQFERATYLICALEFLRRKNSNLNLGIETISIGMWVGKSTTPNHTDELKASNHNKFSQFITDAGSVQPGTELEKLQNMNPFPIAYCPWCGCKLLTESTGVLSGYFRTGELKCQNIHCNFSDNNGLPIHYIDSAIYDNQPTLLFGTVDKFANINNANGYRLFNSRPSDIGLTPDLIIQDELHLISGPLGSMVGIFESIIELMSSKDGRKPKFVASTATTRNTRFLIKQLYNREVCVFPAQGIRYSDNFFSHADMTSKKRLHIGIIPVGHTAAMTEIKLVALLIIAKVRLFKKYLINENQLINFNDYQMIAGEITNLNKLKKDLDDYWTSVLFYNSLKDLGRTKSRIPQEIYEAIRALINYTDFPKVLNFIIENFYNRVSEFTSRENSAKIKSMLTKAESEIILREQSGRIEVQNGLDLIMASNMISVGIDIKRLNVMLFAGQPRSVSEYIQSSSRVARDRKGIVFNLLNANRIRELSLFENFTAFHKVYYKYVEPLSATPYTEATMDRLFNNILVCWVRHIKNVPATSINTVDINPLIQFLQGRCSDIKQQNYINRKMNDLFTKWNQLVNDGTIVNYNYFSYNDEDEFQLMKSLRSIDPDCFARIQSVNYN